MNDMKQCSKCKESKTLSSFGKDSSRKDGLFSHCKSCHKIMLELRAVRRTGTCVGPECVRTIAVWGLSLCDGHSKQFYKREKDLTRLTVLGQREKKIIVSKPLCRGPECVYLATNIAHGLCRAHRAQLRVCGADTLLRPLRTRQPHIMNAVIPDGSSICVGPECTREVHVKRYQLCDAHHLQLARRKSFSELVPLFTKKQPIGAALKRIDDLKLCVGCSEWLGEHKFNLDVYALDGLTVHCRECIKSKNEANNIGVTSRDNYYRKQYGISVEEKQHILDSQGGKCSICSTIDPGSKGWQVDHDRKCCPSFETCGNCIRGILCWRCNVTLGHVEEDIFLLQNMQKYILEPVYYKKRETQNA